MFDLIDGAHQKLCSTYAIEQILSPPGTMYTGGLRRAHFDFVDKITALLCYILHGGWCQIGNYGTVKTQAV